jgi:ADP-heptose:LPS heptosyltransferase
MAKVLIIRLSAIGDVAMTIPVIYSAARAHPSDSFTILTQTFLMPLFINRPENLNILGINTQSSEKTLGGFLRFVSVLRKYKYDTVIDLHSVIRSWIIDLIFRLKRKRVFILDKKRDEQKQLVCKPPKDIRPLRAMTARYADVFHAAGFHFEETFISLYDGQPAGIKAAPPFDEEKTGRWIGIAPFARYRGKVYPVDEMETVVETLSAQPHLSIFLFGARGYEEAILSQWEFQYPHTRCVAGRYSLDRELSLISRLDVLVCMDSANMHFASLVNTPVISIWGATHPFAGFYGYHQPESSAIQTDLPCRPCSIFGKKPCHRGDWACMTQIAPEQIVRKINDCLNHENHTEHTAKTV